jgi:glyoxylase-like metal-dependent hydrolase (beta-lactamase superfamily II)
MLIKNPPVEVAGGVWMLGTNEYPVLLVTDGDEGAIFEGGVGATGPVVKEQEKAVSFFTKIDGMLTEALIKAGSITEKHRPEPLKEKQITIDRILAGGDTVTIGRRKFDVFATPGHSDCGLSFHEPATGLLIISDATGYYIPDSGYFWPNYFTDYGAYLESIRRLAALDAEIVCLSHNAVVKGAESVKAYFEAAAAATEAYHKRIVTEIGTGKPPEEIARQLGIEVHEKTQLLGVEFFQKNCELLVKQSATYSQND